MASTLSYIEYLNSSTATATPTVLNLGSTVASNLDTTTYPCSVGNYSMSKIFKLSFGGTFTSITDVKIYKSAGTYVTGEVLNYGTSSTFHVPTGGSYADSVATAVIPTTLPSTANVTVGGTITYTITTTENTTDYIFLQSSVTTQATAQTVNTKTLTVTWTEA